jgi:hypothetical protein
LAGYKRKKPYEKPIKQERNTFSVEDEIVPYEANWVSIWKEWMKGHFITYFITIRRRENRPYRRWEGEL